MASDEVKSKKDKKEKKEKKLRSTTDGVHKKDKKEAKKADKEKLKQKVASTLDQHLQADAAAASRADDNNDDDDDHPGSDLEDIKNPAVETQLVYFAVPLADAKGHKKIYKTIKKGMYCAHTPQVVPHAQQD